MSWLSQVIARWLWGHMLWLMRRPWMKDLQRRSTKMFGIKFAAKAQASLVSQNRFARKHGLGILRASIVLFLASIAITFTFFFALYLYDIGALSVPETVRQNR